MVVRPLLTTLLSTPSSSSLPRVRRTGTDHISLKLQRSISVAVS